MKVCTNNNALADTFKARSAQIKDAQWVCHKVNSRFAHSSTSRLIPSCNKILENQSENKKDFKQILSLDHLYDYLKALNLNSFKEKDQRLIKFILQKIWDISEARELCFKKYKGHSMSDILPPLSLIEEFKVGNCYEDSTITAMILNINGIKNTCTAKLFSENKDLDHAVCLVNTTGKIFDENKNLNKKTIIIDSWLGMADYAENMFQYYKNMCQNLFNIQPDSKVTVRFFEKIYLSHKDIDVLKQKYPDLNYTNPRREFFG